MNLFKTPESVWFRKLGLNETYLMRLSIDHQKMIAIQNYAPSDFRTAYVEIRVKEIIEKVYE